MAYISFKHPLDVHIAYASLDVASDRLDKLFPLLSQDEKARAEKFYFSRDQKRYIAGRGMLREFLAPYLDISPASLQFEYTSYDKPFLKTETDGPTLHFNLSHSGGMAYYAITQGRKVGIDVEWKSRKVDIDILVNRFFSSAEIHALAPLHESAKQACFFQFWTRKEAFLKAMGMGVSFPLEQVNVSSQVGNRWSLVDWEGEGSESQDWFGQDLFLVNGFAGAVVVEGERGDVIIRKL